MLDKPDTFLAGSTDLMVLALNSTVHRDFGSRSGRIVFSSSILMKAGGTFTQGASKLLGVGWIDVSPTT